jgi:hypothetical protein
MAHENIKEALQGIYTALSQSDLVKSKTLTEDNMKEFNNILNQLVPIRNYECNNHIIRELNDRKSVRLNSLNHTFKEVPYLFLLLSPYSIVAHFDLRKIVHISYNSKEHKFVVSKYIERKVE